MSQHTSSADAIVIGGGIIGCTLAYALQRRGINTILLEQGAIGREASWASAGILGPPTAAGLPPHRAELAIRSHNSYETLLESVRADSGLDTTFLPVGKMLLARTESEVEGLQGQITWQRNHGFSSIWLEPAEVREIEPIIPPDILGAYYAENTGAVTLHRFTEAVAAAFGNCGGEIREHTPAINVIVEGGRVSGVDTPDGPVHAETVVISAGAWSRFLGPALGLNFPMRPVKGQMISVTPRPGGPRPRHIVGNVDGGYLVPRIDGSIAIGASREDSGFDKQFTPGGFQHASNLIDMLGPALRDASFVTGWAGLRPGTIDESPIMGPAPGIVGLWVNTGHYRTGAQLAPGSADLVAAAIAGEANDPLLDQFSLERFTR